MTWKKLTVIILKLVLNSPKLGNDAVALLTMTSVNKAKIKVS